MKKLAGLALIVAAALLLASCGVSFGGGNLRIREGGREILSVGRDGFRLDGNVTGVTLDASGLRVEYPNGSIVWDSGGFDVNHASGSIRIADGKMVVTDKDGRTKTLDTEGGGAEYTTDGGVTVKTGEKAAMPEGYPADLVPLMDGFTLNASAELGGVLVISGYVQGKTSDDAMAFYQPLLMKGDSYSQDKKDNSRMLRAKLDDVGVTIYLCKSLTDEAVNVSIMIGE